MDQLAGDSQTNFSIEEERKVARTFMGRIEWEMIVVGLGQFTVWVITWGLVVNNVIPLWAGFLISTISTACSYLPSHAGQHGHLSGKHKHLNWLNTVVGQISLIPLAQSHHILKATHMKHHAHTNDPERDPDYRHTHVDNWFQSAIQIQNQTGEGGLIEVVEKLSEEDPKFAKTLETGSLVGFVFFFAQMVAAVIYPLETLLLWWLPRKLAVSYLGIIFSHEPHKNLPIGRYKDSRFWSNSMPRYLNHSMQIHVMHHMYPNICHYDEPKAIEALKPFMVARGIPGADKIPDKIKLNPLIRVFS
jgi:beta-carotene hydroxylase